jgi:hypothetical protein
LSSVTSHTTWQIAAGKDKRGGGTLRHRSLVIAEGKLQSPKGKPLLHGGTSRMTLRIAAGKDKRAAVSCDTGALSLPKANCNVAFVQRDFPHDVADCRWQ